MFDPSCSRRTFILYLSLLGLKEYKYTRITWAKYYPLTLWSVSHKSSSSPLEIPINQVRRKLDGLSWLDGVRLNQANKKKDRTL